jgi:Ca-activated chloride channel family protein
MWSLEHPLTLLLLILVALLAYWAHFRPRRGGKIRYNLGVWGEGVPSFPAGGGRFLLWFSRVLFWVGFVLLVIALAGPVVIERQRIYLTKGVDLVIALDESPSMSARDVGLVNRFEAARQVIREFVSGRENDAIGLVAFGQEAVLRVPPTLDYEHLLEVLDSLRIMELGDGTAIGLGIAVSALHLRDSRAQEKVIILVTDGDNNAGDLSPEQAAEIAQELGIRVYTIGIGTEGETTVQFVDPESGRQVQGLYQARLNEELLKAVALQTGGRYFHSGTLGILTAVFREIDSLEKTEQEVNVFVEHRPKHAAFIVAALAFVFAGLGISRLILGELM